MQLLRQVVCSMLPLHICLVAVSQRTALLSQQKGALSATCADLIRSLFHAGLNLPRIDVAAPTYGGSWASAATNIFVNLFKVCGANGACRGAAHLSNARARAERESGSLTWYIG
jgi:hypothetical protein